MRRFGTHRVRPWLAAALRDVGFVDPKPVQAVAMDRIAHHHDTVIHAATGSGKTLAYLVPLISRLDKGVPWQLLVLLPSRELALQVAFEIHQLTENASQLQVALIVGGSASSAQLRHELLDGSRCAEVIVATPEALTRVLSPPQQVGQRLSSDDDDHNPRANWPIPAGRSRRLNVAEEAIADPWVGWPAEQRARAQQRMAADAHCAALAAAKADAAVAAAAVTSASRPDVSVAEVAGEEAAVAAKLLRGMATNLDAIVLDEVDALLPKPVLKESLGYYRQKDWAKAGRQRRRHARPGAPGSSAAGRLVEKILRAATSHRSVSDGNALRPRLRTIQRVLPEEDSRQRARAPRRERPVHMVAASATVSRSLLHQLRDLFGREQLPCVIGENGELHEGEQSRQTRRAGVASLVHGDGESTRGRTHGARGVAGVQVPATIAHRVCCVAEDSHKPAALMHGLKALHSRACLVVLPADASVTAWAKRLTDVGLPHVKLLHEAMGFPSRRQQQPDLAADGSAHAHGATTLDLFDAVGRVREAAHGERMACTEKRWQCQKRAATAAAEAAAAPTGSISDALGGAGAVIDHQVAVQSALQTDPVLLTTELSVRGIDLPFIDCVVLLYVPLTSDAYVHLAGRTGRSKEGVALSIVREDEAKRLGLFTSQLGISMQPLLAAGRDAQRSASLSDE